MIFVLVGKDILETQDYYILINSNESWRSEIWTFIDNDTSAYV